MYCSVGSVMRELGFEFAFHCGPRISLICPLHIMGVQGVIIMGPLYS